VQYRKCGVLHFIGGNLRNGVSYTSDMEHQHSANEMVAFAGTYGSWKCTKCGLHVALSQHLLNFLLIFRVYLCLCVNTEMVR